ncbi:MAG: YceI family protein [Ferruginibacter sp.]|nr:YceI family protein [Ferruginibacter sp.]
MNRKTLYFILFFSAFFGFASAQTPISPVEAGSRVHFVIKNFGIKTGGDFSGIKGVIKFDPKSLPTASFDVTVSSSTVDTDNGSRDGHLAKEEYFDVKKYPVIRMFSTKILGTTKPGRYQFTGNLTIKGITKSITFQFTVVEKDGGYLFAGDDFTINRRDYEVGGSSISLADELKLSMSVLAK